MYSREQVFNYFVKQASNRACLAETQNGSIVGVNTVDHYSRLFVFICLSPSNPKNSIYIQFTFWEYSVTVALINRSPIIPEQPVATVYEDSVIKVINPDPNHPQLRHFTGWLIWAQQIAHQQHPVAA